MLTPKNLPFDNASTKRGASYEALLNLGLRADPAPGTPLSNGDDLEISFPIPTPNLEGIRGARKDPAGETPTGCTGLDRPDPNRIRQDQKDRPDSCAPIAAISRLDTRPIAVAFGYYAHVAIGFSRSIVSPAGKAGGDQTSQGDQRASTDPIGNKFTAEFHNTPYLRSWSRALGGDRS